ncbi:hypothetical protein Thimo_3508 [Thioflavicoccus mobilis 8321]|uniref:Uncharacterized protein n=1 Tax=Thioflavicoccus mobilis 8321 TaxID=765912 RepID=L0H1R0_9GAMM|nr:hypothetical protein [Thioflavicoccus mobilis]AGA92171.1 hypothetical protein Thimo_3508 [Thioflavicoccus mobilis 8321]
MSVATAKAFRQQVLKPADGVFLFHSRAIERLIEEQLGARLLGVSVPDLPYYLMPRADFLLGLETENAEALSVIEGLQLPSYVILLPSPPELGLEARNLHRLQLDYWGRTFEAEVARAWQDRRDVDHDLDEFGAAALTGLIGPHAFAEVRDVLQRDGVALPVWDDDLICRAFVAMVVRLRCFAPAARGFFFPAIRVWDRVDQWLAASGLDLPEPRRGSRLPILLARSRPGAIELPSEPPVLPIGLPFVDSDPDLLRLQQAGGPETSRPLDPPSAPRQPVEALDAELEGRCLAAIRRGSLLRRRSLARRLGAQLRAAGRHLLGRILLLPGFEDIGNGRRPGRVRRSVRWQDLGLAALEEQSARAQRAQLESRFARAIRALGNARRLVQRLHRSAGFAPAAIEQVIAECEADAEEHMAILLAAKWKLGPATTEELQALIARLAEDDRRYSGSAAARAVLRQLEQVLAERRSNYYRLRLGHWLMNPLRHRLRQALPFQPLLKSLRALETARQHLEDLPWSMAELERASAVLATLTGRVTARLDTRITPRLEFAMREADFVSHDHRERIAAQKMRLELLDVIKRRRHLKFTDVRDIVARNILRLPDPTLHEILHGDRLARFDRAAARALPGVYRPGELYIKGLQQLGAPLFGTDTGRSILRHLLLPYGGAFLVLKTLDVVIHSIPHEGLAPHLATPVYVILTGTAVNLVVHTGLGWHLAVSLWEGIGILLRFLFYEGMHQLLRWEPVARLLKTPVMRVLWRNLVHPMLIGTLPLIPIIALAVLVEEVPIQPGLWLAGLAFALGTLARNTPAGRRFLDNLSTNTVLYLRRLNQTLLLGLIQRLLYFFKETMRRFAQWLHRVDEALTHHMGERFDSLLLKTLLAPLWRLAEAVIQFYVTVLVEPQINPVKHFPVVTVGHKILLPFLPAITAAFVEVSGQVLPKVVSYPLVTVTIALLPGLFGFLVWELKENWRLYQANHGRPQAASTAADEGIDMGVEPAIVGSHGETMAGLMMRGFHSGTLPKGFDRLRQVIRDELEEQSWYARRLRRTQRRIEDVRYCICVFFEHELTFALREHCHDPDCALQYVETGRPRIATNLVELQADLYVGTGQGQISLHALGRSLARLDRLVLYVRLYCRDAGIRIEADLHGSSRHIHRYCWSLVRDDLRLFAGRAGADPGQIDLPLPAPPLERVASRVR